MHIEWFGHSCFRLRTASASVICDPFAGQYGALPTGLRADIVTVSHDHPGHSGSCAVVDDATFLIAGPGEYEVRGVFVLGVRMSHDDRGGAVRGASIAYCISMDDVVVCHLGDVAHPPTQEQIETIGSVDVLLVPVGGDHVLGPSQAVEAINRLEPSIVVPMHYRSAVRPELEPVTRFLAEMGVAPPATLPDLTLERAQLPQDAQVVLLEPRA